MKRTPSKEEAKASITLKEFLGQFPDDESCLKHLFDVRFGQGYKCPKCQRKAKWYRIQAERAFCCGICGHHLHPTVGTLFEDSRTSLQSWFLAIYLFTTSRHGVPAKELERQLGVTYKTAWRMGHQIRNHMAQVDDELPLYGEVEIDETYVGGEPGFTFPVAIRSMNRFKSPSPCKFFPLYPDLPSSRNRSSDKT
jgi:transposase-like protein